MAQNAPVIPPADLLRLQMPLQTFGLSQLGASQFLNGQPILDPADRQLLLALVASLIGSFGIPKLDGTSKDPGYLSLKFPPNSNIFRK